MSNENVRGVSDGNGVGKRKIEKRVEVNNCIYEGRRYCYGLRLRLCFFNNNY